LTKVTRALQPYPAFRGWSWASNWWVFNNRGANGAKTAAEKAAYEKALKQARDTGTWDPVLDRVSSYRLNYAVEAQGLFNQTLRSIAPKMVTAVACPHRNVEAYPPVTLANVDEVDLQAQGEQVAVPYHAPHGVDFYKRPGKRAWAHPEIWNDAGTGEQILPTLLQALMRGADGVGFSGPVPPWGIRPEDSRLSYQGTASVYRALGAFLKEYGPWLTTLENNDKVAIVVSGRMLRIDDWPNVMGTHFARLFEAYVSCLHAHQPARYVFVEDLKPDTLKQFKAIIVVGQTVEMENPLVTALQAARAAGVAIFHDGTCRAALVKGFTPADSNVYPALQPPFGHVIPNWDFEIVKKPRLGQYRFLQFARRALAPGTKGIALRLDGESYGKAVSLYAGQYRTEDGVVAKKVADAPPREWQVVRVDLWDLFKKPLRIRGLRLASPGGPAAFDQILLSRAESALPTMKK
jgi:hypothetical protein